MDLGIWYLKQTEKGSEQCWGGSSSQKDGADTDHHCHHHRGSESQDSSDRDWKLADSEHQKGSESQHCSSSSSHQSCSELGQSHRDRSNQRSDNKGRSSKQDSSSSQTPRHIPVSLVGELAASLEQLLPLEGAQLKSAGPLGLSGYKSGEGSS